MLRMMPQNGFPAYVQGIFKGHLLKTLFERIKSDIEFT